MTPERMADMVALHETRGLAEIGMWVGLDSLTVSRYLYRYGGVTPRPDGRYATPRPNDGATLETWRCTRCRRTQGEGAEFFSRKRGGVSSWCRSCRAEDARERYHRRKEAVRR